jgi:hypothetical protein
MRRSTGGLLMFLGVGFVAVAAARASVRRKGRTNTNTVSLAMILVLFRNAHRFLSSGIEGLFSSVFLSMLGISRDTYIGE